MSTVDVNSKYCKSRCNDRISVHAGSLTVDDDEETSSNVNIPGDTSSVKNVPGDTSSVKHIPGDTSSVMKNIPGDTSPENNFPSVNPTGKISLNVDNMS